MFMGKFNFSRVCSNVFSPAFNDLPPAAAEKAAAERAAAAAASPPKRGGGGARSRAKSLQEQNNALDRQTSAFADRHAAAGGEGRPKRAKKKDAAGMRRGLSADPSRKREPKKEAKSETLQVEEVSVPPATSPAPVSPPAPAVEAEEVTLLPHRTPKDRLRHAVHTKVASLNAFRRGARQPPDAAEEAPPPAPPPSDEGEDRGSGILKTGPSSGRGRSVTFSSLPQARSPSLSRSVPDLRDAISGGSSFDSSRSLSDESVAPFTSAASHFKRKFWHCRQTSKALPSSPLA